MDKLKRLFEPVKIGTLEIPNRIIMAPITTKYDSDDVGRMANFYAERAKGGAGLLITGAIQVLYPGRRVGAGKLNLYDDSSISGLQQLTKAVHDAGGYIAPQMAAYGYWASRGMESTAEDVGPSAVEIPTTGLHPSFSQADFLPRVRALTVPEIHAIEEAIGDAALRARKAGFDAAEFQVAAGNLLCQFINPFTNRRTDEYGGSLENRTRIAVRAIADIRKKAGDDFPLICRVSGLDMVPWGQGLEEWKQIARILEAAGAHALSVYPGWKETREPKTHMSVPRGAFVYLAEGIKGAVGIPVAANVRINDPLLAEEILEQGRADLIAMAAPLIADPYLPLKAREGRLDDIRMCTACCHCWEAVGSDRMVTCSVNARAGSEGEYDIVPAEKSKSVVVIGGGPAGMEAARIAARRGHRVTLFEKGKELGGQLLYAVLPPYKEEWLNLVRYLKTQLNKLEVDVRLNEECTARTIEQSGADAVIVATGATPCVPDIPGVGGKNVSLATDVLAGKQVGQNVVIIGGGSTGCETAEFLHRKGKKVTVLEMLGRIGADIGGYNRWVVIDRLAATGIRMETNTRVDSINEKGVRVTRAGKYLEFFEADSVVIAAGMLSDNALALSLEGKVPELYQVGDCYQTGRVREAILEGFKAGLRI